MACNLGFDLVDVRVTMVRGNSTPVPPSSDNVSVQPAEESDAPALLELAGHSFLASRFYVDTRFPRARVDSLFQHWLQRDLQTSGHRVMVVRSEGTIVGFASGSIDHDRARVSLVAVDSAARGRGVGQAGLLALLRFFQTRGAEKVTVVTQAQNASAVGLYENCGFRTVSIQLWLHKWFR
ncbi:MAG TPA: GNAT family N-acetyltransferase [Acidobacteriota bacterium]